LRAAREPCWRTTLAAPLGGLAFMLLLAGCGVASPDLFEVRRSGPHGTALTMVVSEEGVARCNRGAPYRLPDRTILEARSITEDLHKPISRHLRLPAQQGSVFAYAVRDAEGNVSFADNSAGQPNVLERLQLFVAEVAPKACPGASGR
jgi:hypothetical protein